MRRIAIAATIAAALSFAMTGCEPPTVTATPSTVRPACREITTVTGVGTPASEIRNVVIDIQISGQWKPWVWYADYESSRKEMRAGVKADGTFTIKYVPPTVATAGNPARLRVRGFKMVTDTGGAVSHSWYVTPPSGC